MDFVSALAGMDEIIKAISQKINLPESVVRQGLGIVLNLVKQRSTGTQFEQLIKLIPGAGDVVAGGAPVESSEAGGMLGGLLGKAGGLLGGDLGAAAEALGSLQKAGIPVDKAGPLAKEFFDQAGAIAGPETVNALLEQMPALKSLVGRNA